MLVKLPYHLFFSKYFVFVLNLLNYFTINIYKLIIRIMAEKNLLQLLYNQITGIFNRLFTIKDRAKIVLVHSSDIRF